MSIRILLIIGFIVIVLGIVSVLGFWSYQKIFLGENLDVTQTFSKIISKTSLSSQGSVSQLEIDVKIPKDTYKIGEPFNGEYYLKYTGLPFRAFIRYCIRIPLPEYILREHRDDALADQFYRTGLSCSATGPGILSDINFTNDSRGWEVGLGAFQFHVSKENEPFEYYLISPYASTFNQPGQYKYSMEIYDCKDVESVIKLSDCGNEKDDNFATDLIYSKLNNFKPIASKFKTITVVIN